jgi:aromatic ring hydroxylase
VKNTIMQNVETLWADFATPIRTAEDYVASLRGRDYLTGQRVAAPVDHPVIRRNASRSRAA